MKIDENPLMWDGNKKPGDTKETRWEYCKPEPTLDKILNINSSAFSNDTANPELEPEARKEILKEINEQYSGSDADQYAD